MTGAAGLVGTHTCRELARRGWRVRALVRDASQAAARLAGSVSEIRVGDLRDVAALDRALEGSTAVVHLAAVAIERGRDTYRSINTDATRLVLDRMAARGIARLIFTSQNGASSESPFEFLRSKGIAEDAVRSSAVAWTVLRPSVIFGPEDGFTTVLARLARITPLVLPLPGGGRSRFQPVAADDVARAIALSLERASAEGTVYAIGGAAPLTLREMAERILAAMEISRSLIGVPIALVRPVVALAQRLLPNPPVTTGLLDLLSLDNVVSRNSLREDFGIEPVPFAPEHLRYLRRITLGDAIRSFF